MISRTESHLLWRLYQSIILACIALLVSACDSRGFMEQETPSASIDDTLQVIPVTQVAGTDATITQLGLPFQFIAVDIVDGEYQMVSDQVTWISSAPDIADINHGQAIGKAKGSTFIQVQLGNRLSNQVKLDVRDQPMLVLQIKAGEQDHPIGTLFNQLPVNAKQSLVAIATYADHTSFDVTHHVEWVSSHPKVMTVENALAHMQSQGNSDLHAVYLGEYVSNVLPFIVTDATLEFLKISPANATTAAHSHTNFTAIATYSDYTNQDVSAYVDWHSSQHNIATINQGEAEALSPGNSQITASLLGMTSSSSTLTVTDAQLVRLQITPSEPQLDLGESLFFKVKAIYDDGSTDDVTDHALWQSSQPNVSNVAAGYTKANNVGHTEISASLHGIESNKANLTVNQHQLMALQVTPALVELAQGTQAELKVIASYDDDTTRDITNKVTWQTHSPEVALIDHGHVSAISVGNTHIHAVFDGIESNDAEITVIDANVTALQITPAIETVPVSGQVEYVAQATFSDGELTTTQDVSHLVAWKSQHHDIATLAHGAAIGVQPGDAKILAVLNQTYQTANLKVIDKLITALQVTPATQTVAKGTMSQYRAIATYDDNSSEDVTDLVNWSSSDSTVATLYSGELEAVDVGQVTISANYQGIKSNQAQLTVEEIELTAIQITPPNDEIQVGTNTSYRAIGLYSNDTSRDITDLVHWNSSDTDIATILLNQVTLNTEHTQLASTSGEIATTASETQDSDHIFAIASGISAGSAFISADLDGIESNQAQLTVNAASLQSLQITPANIELAKGNSIQYQVIGHYSDGSSIELTENVHWQNSQPQVATIIEGEAVAISQGQTQIVANIQGIQSNPASLVVTAATVSSLQITPAIAQAALGSDVEYHVIAIYSDNSTQDVSQQVSWSIDNNQFATVEQGIVHTSAIGEVAIQAHLNQHSSNIAKLSITDAKLTSLVLSPVNITIASGSDVHYQIMGGYSDGSSKDLSHSAHLQTNSPNLVVFADNEAHTLNKGQAEVSAHINGIISNTAKLNISEATVTQLQITPANIQLANGTDAQYQAIARYSDGSTQVITESISWKTNNTGIATIDSNGEVHALAQGQTSVTASYQDIESNHAQLTITEAKLNSIQITPALSTIPNGTDIELHAIATYSDNTTQDVSHAVTWKTSNAQLATINQGVVHALQQGLAQFSAHIDEISSNIAKINITDAKLISLQLTPSQATIANGNHQHYQVVGHYSDNSSKDLSHEANISSSNANVAVIVDAEAETTAAGTSLISAELNGIMSNQAKLTVTAATITAIQVTPTASQIAKGTELDYHAIASYTDGSTQDISDKVDWHSSQVNIATINQGLAHADLQGQTQISASQNGISSNVAFLDVTAAEIMAIQVTPAVSSIALGFEQQYTAIATYSDNSVQDMTTQVDWSSSNINTATIVGGLAATNNTGNINIKASYQSIHSNLAQLNVTDKKVIQLQLTPTDIEFALGTSTPIHVQASYSDGTSAEVTDNVSWILSNSSIVAIDGIAQSISAVSEGQTHVRAKWQTDNIESNPISVTVSAATLSQIILNPDELTIKVGSHSTISAYGIYSDSSYQSITNQVDWVSSNTNVATILNGELDGINIGEITVSATMDNISAQAKVIVEEDKLISLRIEPAQTEVPIGTELQLKVVGIYQSGTEQDISSSKDLQWSSNSSNLTIDATGVVYGVNQQNGITVTVRKDQLSQTKQINVTDAVVKMVEVKQEFDHLNTVFTAKSKRQFKAIATMTDNSKIDVTRSAAWQESTNSAKATVVKGLVTTTNSGSSDITAIYKGVTSAPFTITMVSPSSRSCASNKITIPYAGGTRTFTCPLTTTEYGKSSPKRTGNGATSPRGMLIPMANYWEANNNCKARNMRLPSVNELRALHNAADVVSSLDYQVYTRFGWPIEVAYWTNEKVDRFHHRIVNMVGGAKHSKKNKFDYYWTCVK